MSFGFADRGSAGADSGIPSPHLKDPAREAPMRLDGVEVKISLDSDQTAKAVEILDLA